MSQLVKVFVEDLQFGMFVSELDRPWLESPFLFQGFEINNSEVIQQLCEYCEYVYVDPEESNVRIVPQKKPKKISKLDSLPDSEQPKTEAKDTFKYDEFKLELKHALDVHQSAHNYIKSAMKDVRVGESLDTKSTKLIVSKLADSIVQNSTALIWLMNLKDRDEYTSQHSLNVCILSLLFGQYLGLSKDKLNILGVGALLHDIGKLKVPLNILNKPDRLTDQEFFEMKRHPTYGYELLLEGRDLHEDSLDIVHHHHEYLDGSGYPDGLIAKNIKPFTKLVSIIDIYDAVTSRRVYHNETTPNAALNNLYHESNSIIDHKLLEQFIKCVGIYPVGSVVELNTGHIGVVMAFSEVHHLQPIVMLVLDHNKMPYEHHRFINLANPTFASGKRPPRIAKIVEPERYNIDLTSICINETFSKAV